MSQLKNLQLDRNKVIEFFLKSNEKSDFTEVFKLKSDRSDYPDEPINDMLLKTYIAVAKSYTVMSKSLISEDDQRKLLSTMYLDVSIISLTHWIILIIRHIMDELAISSMEGEVLEMILGVRLNNLSKTE